MKATIRAIPRYHLTFTPEELSILQSCSANHYDAVCRNASKVGGFIYGWFNMLNLDSTDGCLERTADWRQLDICCKILEMPYLAEGGKAREMRQFMLHLHAEAERHLSNIAIEV